MLSIRTLGNISAKKLGMVTEENQEDLHEETCAKNWAAMPATTEEGRGSPLCFLGKLIEG